MAEAADPKFVRFDAQQLLGDKLLCKENGKPELQSSSKLSGKYVAIYFSAHWCPPCRQFTPQLVKTYNQLKDKKPFEVVFVSSDRNVEAFSEYYDTMPWAAVPFGEYGIRRELSNKLRVTSIPALFVFGPDGALVNANARADIARDPKGSAFPWHGSKQIPTGGMLDVNKVILLLLLLYLLYRFCF